MNVWIKHTVFLLWQYIIDLWCNRTLNIRNSTLQRLRSSFFEFRQIHRIFLLSNWFEYRNWERSGKWRVCLASNSHFNIIYTELLLLIITIICRNSWILFEYFRFLENLSSVIMHELKKLIYNILFIVLNSLFLKEPLYLENELGFHLFLLSVLSSFISRYSSNSSWQSLVLTLLH